MITKKEAILRDNEAEVCDLRGREQVRAAAIEELGVGPRVREPQRHHKHPADAEACAPTYRMRLLSEVNLHGCS